MVAHLASRKPSYRRKVAPVPGRIPWAVPYRAGERTPYRKELKPGSYILQGQASGTAHVRIATVPNSSVISTVAVTFNDFSGDGLRIVSGHQDVSRTTKHLTLDRTTWYSDVVQRGVESGWQKIGPEGFYLAVEVTKNVFHANGTLVTGAGGTMYGQPMDRT